MMIGTSYKSASRTVPSDFADWDVGASNDQTRDDVDWVDEQRERRQEVRHEERCVE